VWCLGGQTLREPPTPIDIAAGTPLRGFARPTHSQRELPGKSCRTRHFHAGAPPWVFSLTR